MELKMIRGEQVEIGPELESDASINKDIQPYHDALENKIKEVLCYNPRNLSREEADLESSLGNFYADVCLESADSIFFNKTGKHIDFALFNYGGIRTAIPVGPITVEHIFKLMPFENKLVVANLSGSKVTELLNYLAKRGQAHPIAGLQLEVKDEKFVKIKINGENFDPNKNYWVLTHDYLQHGGDQMSFFIQPLDLYTSEYKVRDALIDHLRTLDTLKVSLDNRYTKLK